MEDSESRNQDVPLLAIEVKPSERSRLLGVGLQISESELEIIFDCGFDSWAGTARAQGTGMLRKDPVGADTPSGEHGRGNDGE